MNKMYKHNTSILYIIAKLGLGLNKSPDQNKSVSINQLAGCVFKSTHFDVIMWLKEARQFSISGMVALGVLTSPMRPYH